MSLRSVFTKCRPELLECMPDEKCRLSGGNGGMRRALCPGLRRIACPQVKFSGTSL